MREVATFAQFLTHEGILTAITEQVRFARARFGRYDLIDFVAVLIGYAVSGEPTLLAFYVEANALSKGKDVFLSSRRELCQLSLKERKLVGVADGIQVLDMLVGDIEHRYEIQA
jgi:hypothetical protein